MKKLTLYLMPLLMAMMIVGCSSDDEDENYSFVPNILQIRDGKNTDTKSYSVTNAYYLQEDKNIIFRCDINSTYTDELFIIIKRDSFDNIQPGETFQLNQFYAHMISYAENDDNSYYNVTKRIIKLVDRKRVGDKEVLSLQINNLTIDNEDSTNEGHYIIINGLVDYGRARLWVLF